MTAARLTLILLFALCMHDANAQFVWSNPLPAGHHNNKIVFVNKDTGFIINTNGDFIRTTNQGATWSVQRNFYRGYMLEAKDSMIITLGSLKSRKAIPALAAIIRVAAQDHDTRWTAVESLGTIVRRRFTDKEDPIEAALDWLTKHPESTTNNS